MAVTFPKSFTPAHLPFEARSRPLASVAETATREEKAARIIDELTGVTGTWVDDDRTLVVGLRLDDPRLKSEVREIAAYFDVRVRFEVTGPINGEGPGQT